MTVSTVNPVSRRHLRQRKTPGRFREAERLSRRLTTGANKPSLQLSLLQVGGAGRVVGKKSLELWERLWEPKIARQGSKLCLLARRHLVRKPLRAQLPSVFASALAKLLGEKNQPS